ncbi:rhomboid family intramembrane serine protease [bacterium]|nr:rhomboid family intramembrane serine protease [bacterium]
MRRQPWFTYALLAANVLFFALTIGTILSQEERIGLIEQEMNKLRLRVFTELQYADNPPATALHGVLDSITDLEAHNAVDFKAKLQEKVTQVWDDFTAGRLVGDTHPLYREYLGLNETLREARAASLLGEYAFTPADHDLKTTVTYAFLHAGMLHLLGNLLIIYLAGAIIEDVLGAGLFLAFYFGGAIVAALCQGAMHLGSTQPVIGASGAAAALMGGYLVRFFRSKIQMFWLLWIFVVVRWGKTWVPAFVLLPFWFAMQVLAGHGYGLDDAPIAYWAHAGGFAFGAGMMGTLMLVGLTKRSVVELEKESLDYMKANVRTDYAPLHEAWRYLMGERYADAAPLIDEFLTAHPGNVEGLKTGVEIALGLGDMERAGELARQVLTLAEQTDNLGLVRDLRGIFAKQGRTLAVPDRQLFDLAKLFEDRMEIAEAVDLYDELARSRPDSPLAPKALYQSARVLRDYANQNADAAARLQRLIDGYPEHPLAEDARMRLASSP